MRVDKFLRMSRLIKRRTVTKEAREGGWVKTGDKIAKPGGDVRIGNIIEIFLGQGEFKCRVVDLENHAGENKAQPLHESL